MKRVDLDVKQGDIENLIYHLARYKFVKRQIKADCEILEIGCGKGYGAYFLSKYAKSVDAVDTDKEVISYARKTYKRKNLNFYTDINKVMHKKYDVIICFEVIEHMRRNEALKLMKIIKKLKKGTGIAYISTPRRIPYKLRTNNRKKYHIHEYSYNELTEDLNKVFKASVILGQLDEVIGSLNKDNVWTYFTINF